MPKITESTHWRVVVPAETFQQIKSNQEFCSLVGLARVVNALHFVHEPLMRVEGDDTPAGMRTRYNSLLFTCGLFAEATKAVQGMHT